MSSMREPALRMLEGNIIPFWQSMRDDKYGGFYGLLDFDLNLDKHASKGCILNSRILWFFSEAARVLNRPELLNDARHAYEFLTERCIDHEYNGVYWSVTFDGLPEDTTKHTYNQAFAVYALSAYYEAGGDPEALVLARRLFTLIEDKCTDDIGYLEAFDRAFTPVGNEKLSENGVMADKTMNTLLHVFEAYGGLYRAAKDPAVARRMRFILDIFQNKLYNSDLNRQEVFFDAHYNSILDLTSYGHDIEASWLVEWGCELLADDALLKDIQSVCGKLTDNVLQKAYRSRSLRNECDRGREDETRVWWVQAEGVVGFLNMSQKHPDKAEYLTVAKEIFAFIMEHIVDKRPGSEWLSEVTPNCCGAPRQGSGAALCDDDPPSWSSTAKRKPIVEPWKCPYHNGRMCLEIIRRLTP